MPLALGKLAPEGKPEALKVTEPPSGSLPETVKESGLFSATDRVLGGAVVKVGARLTLVTVIVVVALVEGPPLLSVTVKVTV